jgi:hypothetical protein
MILVRTTEVERDDATEAGVIDVEDGPAPSAPRSCRSFLKSAAPVHQRFDTIRTMHQS